MGTQTFGLVTASICSRNSVSLCHFYVYKNSEKNICMSILTLIFMCPSIFKRAVSLCRLTNVGGHLRNRSNAPHYWVFTLYFVYALKPNYNSN